MASTKEKEKEKQIWKGETADIWSEDEEKRAWLADARYEDPDFPVEMAEHRLKAMNALYSIVSRVENQEVIWGDQLVREALLSSAEARHDEIVRSLAVGCLVKLSLCRANRKAMLEDKDSMDVLIVSGGKEAPDAVRGRAYLALANLTLQLRGAEDIDEAQKLLKALVLGTDKSQPLDVRSRVFGALWSMAACAANLKAMWKNLDIRFALAAAVLPEETENLRSNALAVIWTMAGDEMNRESMWQDEALRAAILTAIAADQPSTVRVNAMNALRNLGMTVALQQPLWECEEIPSLLLQAVSIGQPADVRASALHVLIQLGSNWRNGRRMVQAGVRDILHQAADDEQLELGDRRAARYAADRLEGAEDWELEADVEEPQEREAAERDGIGAGDGSLADGAEAEPGAETGELRSRSIDPSAGVLQAGVLERAGYAP